MSLKLKKVHFCEVQVKKTIAPARRIHSIPHLMRRKSYTRHDFLITSVCILILGLLSVAELSAQINLKWVRRDYVINRNTTTATMATHFSDRTESVTVDSDGNSYALGEFYNWNPPDMAGTTPSPHKQDIFIHKYDQDGNLQWKNLVCFKAINNLYPNSYNHSYIQVAGTKSIATNGSHLFVLLDVHYPGGVDTTPNNHYQKYTQSILKIYDRRGDIAHLSPNQNQLHNGILVVYDLVSGDYVRHSVITGGLDTSSIKGRASVKSLAVDNTGNAYVLGYSRGKTVYSNTIYDNDSDDTDMFVAKFDVNGDPLWVSSVDPNTNGSSTDPILGSSCVVPNSLVFDQVTNSLYTIGYFEGQTSDTSYRVKYASGAFPNYPADSSYVPSSGSNQSSSGKDIYITRLSPIDGIIDWTKKYGSGASDEVGYDIAIENNELYALVKAPATVYYPSSPLAISSTAGNPVHCLKLYTSNNEQVKWMQQLESAATINPKSIRAVNDEIYLSGYFSGNVDRYGSSGESDIFMAKYNTDGAKLWVSSFGGLRSDYAYSMDIHNDGDIILGGAFYETADFQPSPNLIFERTSYGEQDPFLARFGCYEVSIDPPTATPCAGIPLTFTTSTNCPTGHCNFSYEWNNNLGDSSFSYIGAYGSNTVKLATTDSLSGCKMRDSIALNFKPEVSVSVNPSSAEICEGDSVILDANPTFSNSAITWYKNVVSANSKEGNGRTLTANSAGLYIAQADFQGCISRASVIIEKHRQHFPRIVPDTPQLCPKVKLEVVGCPDCNFTWRLSNGNYENTNRISYINADATGPHEVEMVDENGCLYEASVEVKPPTTAPPPSIQTRDLQGQDGITSVCNNKPVILETTFDPNYDYLWSNSDSTNSIVAFRPGDYRVTVTNKTTGCSRISNNVVIDSVALSIPLIKGTPQNICDSDSAILTVENTCNGCAYTWFLDNDTSPYNSTSTLSTDSLGDYYVEVKDGNGCVENSSVLTVGAETVLKPSITSSTRVVCSGNSVLLSTPNCRNCAYQWYKDSIIITPATDSTHTTTQPGNYQVEVTYGNTCKSMSHSQIIEVSSPTLQIGSRGSTNIICAGTSVLLEIEGTSYGHPPSWSYQWFLNGNPLSGETGFSHTATVAGNYYLEARDDNGCERTSNAYEVKYSNIGANPIATASPGFICSSTQSTINTSGCTNCSYQWFKSDGTRFNDSTARTYSTSTPGGYYVQVTSPDGNCTYKSNVVEVLDSVLPSPVLTTTSSTACSERPIVLSTDPCTNCNYVWMHHYDSSGSTSDTVVQNSPQNTYTVPTNAPGTYSVQLVINGCESVSNRTAVSFSNISASLPSPSIAICNGTSVRLEAQPNNCPTCSYQWLRNNRLVPHATADALATATSGDYQVIVKNPEGCSDTSAIVEIKSVDLAVNIRKSANVICGNNATVVLEIDPCAGCTYQWFQGNFPVPDSTDTSYTVNGPAAAGSYKVEVSNSDCVASDTLTINTGSSLNFTVTEFPTHGSACNGSPITMESSCTNCSHQWYLNDTAISAPLGIQNYLHADMTGRYFVVATGSNGCVSRSTDRVIRRVNQPSDFLLDFDTMTTLPITSGVLHMNNYLQPWRVHNGIYTSSTANNAINSFDNTFDPSLAGPGFHIVTYSYTEDNCQFTTVDTLRVLEPTAVFITNTTFAGAPQAEACVNDEIRIELRNFEFIPDRVIFSTGGSGTDTVLVTPNGPNELSSGGVWSGYISVTVPSHARTGKLIFTDGTASYETDFFLVIQHPIVSLNLAGVNSMLCSNSDNIRLLGVPARGTFKAAYAVDTATYIPSLISNSDSLLFIDSITGYNADGIQNIQLSYVYWPKYTGSNQTCQDSIVDILNIEARDVTIDSVLYTPISLSQTSEPMANLTQLVLPTSSRLLGRRYQGAYVSNDTLLPSIISTGAGPQAITYEVINGTCSDATTDSIRILDPPNMDAIPDYLCRDIGPITIGRNGSGLYFIVGGDTSSSQSSQYVWDESLIGSSHIQNNIMEVTGEGIYPRVLSSGGEIYEFRPDSVNGLTAAITLRFKYKRIDTYFNPSSSDTTEYVIAAVTKIINLEEPFVAAINPAIVANPVFCRKDINTQFSGIPTGGSYYIDDSSRVYKMLGTDTLYNMFNPTDHSSGTHTLRYVRSGNACSDSSDFLTITIPDSFSIELVAPAGPEYCVNSADDTITHRITHGTDIPIDPATGILQVDGNPSGTVFSASQKPPGTYAVSYTISDSLGCSQQADTTFVVHAIPDITLSTPGDFESQYCLNASTIPLSISPVASTGNTLELSARDSMLGPNHLIYSPLNAGVGWDTITFEYTDTNECTNVVTASFEILPLPNLELRLSNDSAIEAQYCEGTQLELVGWPIGGSFDSVSTTNSDSSEYSLNASYGLFTAQVTDSSLATVEEVFQYAYTDTRGCTDTIMDTITILNYTVEVSIDSLADVICADSNSIISIQVNATSNSSVRVDTGILSASIPTALNQTRPMQGIFYSNPDSLGITDAGTRVILTYQYLDSTCPAAVHDTVWVNPLPQLDFTRPGAYLLNSRDSVYHTCISFSADPITVYNTYNGNLSVVTPDTVEGNGIVDTIENRARRYEFNPAIAGPGTDILKVVYTDNNGCRNYISDTVVVDVVPELSVIGYAPDPDTSNPNRYVYCANDSANLVIPYPFGGVMTFGGTNVAGNLLNLNPPILAASTGNDTTYRLSYVYTSQIYRDGRTCADSIQNLITIQATPSLSWASPLPANFCIGDTLVFIPLSANPSGPGGIFKDITKSAGGGLLRQGIAQDTLFDPAEQTGDRIIIYQYTDPAKGCTDSLYHNMSVYRIPKVEFTTEGGCQASAINFVVDSVHPTGLNPTFPALDSLTRAIWNYGDGTIDTIRTFPDKVTVRSQRHSYTTPGVYFPTLTLENAGQCLDSFTDRMLVSPLIAVHPDTAYVDSFERSTNDWIQEDLDSSGQPSTYLWERGIAEGNRINTEGLMNHVWATNLDGVYSKGVSEQVYSPCFDISRLDRPMVALDIWRDSREGVDGAVLEYFDDTASTWKRLGRRNKGLGWYDSAYIISSPGNQQGTPLGWSGSSSAWEEARYRLDLEELDLRGRSSLRFRVAFESLDNTIVSDLEGFAFDNFYVGNRTKHLLVEHFSNRHYPNIGRIEADLYKLIYSNLYGRDVSLIQFHTDKGNHGYDALFFDNRQDVNVRTLYYGVRNANRVRLSGQNAVSRTDSLIARPEVLDREMLEHAKFQIKFVPNTYNVINGRNLNAKLEIKALADLPEDEYVVRLFLTEDSIIRQGRHLLMAVMRQTVPDIGGLRYRQAWTKGQTVSIQQQATLRRTFDNFSQAQLVVVIENLGTKEVYQVATTRDLTAYDGPISSSDQAFIIAPEAGGELVDLNVYPNPAQAYFTVEFNRPLAGTYDWQLVDVLGREMDAGKLAKGTDLLSVATESLAAGMYIFSVRNDRVYTQRKIIVRR